MTSGRIITEALTASGMEMRSNTMDNGAHRILGLPGTAEQQADGTVACVFVKGGNAAIENVVLTTADARSIVLNGEATGIHAVDNGKKAIDNWYDLGGQKVNGAKKGIVIRNGRKVVLK